MIIAFLIGGFVGFIVCVILFSYGLGLMEEKGEIIFKNRANKSE